MKHFYFFTIILLLAFVGGCKRSTTSIDSSEPAEKRSSVLLSDKQMSYVNLDTAHVMASAEQFSAVGEISFAEDNVVRIYPIVSGKVESVYVSLGDYVHTGQLLATLLSTDISQYQKEYSVAKANLDVEEKNYSRILDLYKSGMLSDKDLAQGKTNYDNAKSEFNEKKKILELYGGSENQDAVFRVYATRPGYVVERNITAGIQIRADNSASMFTISNLKTVWVWANVHEGDISKVHEGDEVSVHTIAYPDKVFRSTIKKINNVLDPESRVVRVRIVLDNAEGLLKPEMFATVLITPRNSEKVLVVSNGSIIMENNDYYVMLEIGKNEFKKVQIIPGRVFHHFTEVEDGLKLGDRVIGEGALFVLTAYNQL